MEEDKPFWFCLCGAQCDSDWQCDCKNEENILLEKIKELEKENTILKIKLSGSQSREGILMRKLQKNKITIGGEGE